MSNNLKKSYKLLNAESFSENILNSEWFAFFSYLGKEVSITGL